MPKGQISPGIFILTILFIAVYVFIQKFLGKQVSGKDWEAIRCRPDVMFFASFYGHNTQENINFCLTKTFESRATSVISPFYTFLRSFAGILVTLLQSINSIRMTFATLVGSITTVMSNFKDRIEQLFFRMKVAIVRIRYLMGRVYGSLFAVIYMMMSGLTATTNFGNTFLFKFLDTFCFDPDTPITLYGSTRTIPIKDVRIGDRLAPSGTRVTSVFKFAADGQPMVRFTRQDGHPPILVSSNHYILHGKSWIRSDAHPAAEAAPDWSGGEERPLICLNTEDHTIPIAHYLFSDYDETAEADAPTMEWVLAHLNGRSPSQNISPAIPEYTTCVRSTTTIRKKDGSLGAANTIQLGDQLTTGTVVGIVKKEIHEVSSTYPSLTPGTARWNATTNQWERPGDAIQLPASEEGFSFVVIPSAQIELESGERIRDYVEIHSPETKDLYGVVLQN
jgi:hypothetical protein